MKSMILALLLLYSPVLLAADLNSSATQQTLTIVKPDAVAANHTGDIIARFEKGNLKVVALKMTQLTKEQAQQFYDVHKDKSFYPDLVTFMSRRPVVVMALEGNDAVAKAREVIGATNPKMAAAGTIRADFASSVTENAVHGSDSVENAQKEISFFFKPQEIFKR